MLSRGLSDAEQHAWDQEHRIHLPCPFDTKQLQSLANWTSELEAWPETPGRWMKYFENGKGDDTRQLCRIENFIPYHEGLRQLIVGPGVMTILEQLMGETPCLFKEKINYKLPGGSGFEPHQDAPAFTSFDQRFHVTLLIAVDAQTRENGCLEFSDPVPIYETLPQSEGGALETELGNRLPWRAMELAAGAAVFFELHQTIGEVPRRRLAIDIGHVAASVVGVGAPRVGRGHRLRARRVARRAAGAVTAATAVGVGANIDEVLAAPGVIDVPR